ncbi:uncharacterized protein A4U43_C02F18900 [Asparagus officinalis]|uniref:Bifunctional inhibitor/plant lipid transfer protein/seed storage helical domain-containing protein n=1 Tax=Asparagus officinalis TaxID=4686 RepID=A0A5P1FNA1_ASPOF|nr:uncharacterized protein LOC109829634 [Asparagus officinalis]ONK78449.1 uncharacterized protein A4U43_C02F18900 [Asparagus officinalis]
MSVLNMRSSVVAAAIVAIFLLSAHRTQAEVCNGDLTKLGEVCQQFVLKPGPQKDPSPECCQVIQSADVPCCCANIPKGLEDIISMEKVVYVAKFCGKPLKGGSKCGSYTVPPMA